MTGDPYVALGVAPDATPDEIRAAYEQKVNAAAKSGALGTVQRIDAAYEVLRNPHRRRLYDETGTTPSIQRLPQQAVPLTPGRNWTPTEVTATPRRRSWRGAGALVIAVLLVAGAAYLGLLPQGRTGGGTRVFGGDTSGASVHTGAGPRLHRIAHPKRLLPAVAPPAGVGGYTLIDSDGAAPPQWDPCRPIRYVLSGAEPWPGANDSLRAAIADISRFTGLAFQDAGTTTELPSPQRSSFQLDRYGMTWAPVLIAWTDPAQSPALSGSVIGRGGPAVAVIAGHQRYVSGAVMYDAPQLARVHGDTKRPFTVRQVLLHELGHLVGLGHVADPESLMAPATTDASTLTPGDLRGLAAMGAGTCSTLG